MADIQEKILSKYEIDIAKDNVFKLYKIEKADISPQELDAAIDATRKRWNQSINGANEKIADRDRARLANADKYEAILRDDKLRKEVFEYYNGGGNHDNQGQSSAPLGGLDFAREYFTLLQTSKKIRREDVAFFFNYYQAERKNKKAIIEMLDKEFKVKALGKEEKYASEGSEDEIEGKEKDDSSPLIVNLFQEATVIKIRRCAELLENAAHNKDICSRFPSVREGLYEFLELKNIENIDQFREYVTTKGQEIYQIRQEDKPEYIPLVDLFNTLKVLLGYSDVVDNVPEFILLLKYPNLTPYMYSFKEMKPGTLKGIINIANRDYRFRDDSDFITKYYIPVHDNFGITNSGIGAILKKAEKKAKANKILDKIDEKTGRNNRRKISLGAEIVHWLVYLPIYIVYLIFEVFKAVFTELYRFSIPIFVLLFIGSNVIFPKIFEMPNLLYLRKIFFKNEWLAYLEDFSGKQMLNGFEAVMMSLIVIILMLMLYVLPSLFISYFIFSAAEDLNKRYDWIGYERTFKNIFEILRKKTEDKFIANHKVYFKNSIPKILVNIACFLILFALIFFAPRGLKVFGEKTGYKNDSSSQNTEKDVDALYEEWEENNKKGREEHEKKLEQMAKEDYVTISVSEINLYNGAGSKDNDVIATAKRGEMFVMTGNSGKSADGDGRTWYEIYLDDNKSETAWVSGKAVQVNKKK